MVTDYSGTAAGQALFNNGSPNHLGTVSDEQSGGRFSVRVAPGHAAANGFLKMLIHRWYRMLQPSARPRWDVNTAEISRRGLVLLQSISSGLYSYESS